MKDFIKIFLIIQGFLMILSSFFYSFTITDKMDDKWFTRLALAFICFGFYGIIAAIDNNNK